MVSTSSFHFLQWNQCASMIIHDECVIQEYLESILEPSCNKKMSILSHNVSAALWELESILNVLAFTVVMQNFVGVNELSVLLEQYYAGQYVRVEPVLHLVIAGKVHLNEVLKLSVNLID
jgi:hypothetical protein